MKASETTIRTDATTTAAATATGSEQASPNSHENRLPWYLREAAQHDSVHIQTYTGNFGKRKEEEKEPRGHGREDDPLRQPQPSVDQDQEEDDSDRARLFLCNDDEHHQRLDVPTTTGTFHSSSMLPTDSRTTGTGTHIHARECHGDADQNTHVHMHMHIHNHPTQPKRQKKRTRYPFEHDDAFVKFTGSMEDLKQKFQPIHAGHNAATDASDQEVSSIRTRFLATIRHYFAEGYGYHAVIINTCIPLWMLILFIMLLWVKRNRYVHSNVLSKHSRTMELDRGDDDKSSTRSETQSTMKTKCEQDDSQNGETIPNDNHATAVEPKDNKYLPPMEIRQEDDAENDRSDVAALCSVEIPAMADVIASRTGLNQQDSIRIATQEILAARRRAVEDARKEQVMRLDYLRKALDHALSLLQNRIVSTACGTHLILCIGIGCVTRILMSNPDIVLKWLRSGQDTETYVEVLYSIFVKDICGCLDIHCGYYDTNTDVLGQTPLGLYTTSVLKYIGTSSIASVLYPDSPFIGRCVAKYFGRILLISIAHKVLQVFRSAFLHQLLNLAIVSLFALRTEIGRSMIWFMIEIIGFNVICCGATYYGKVRFGLFINHHDLHEHSFASKTTPSSMMEGQINDLRRKLVRTERMKRDLMILSIVGAFILGCI